MYDKELVHNAALIIGELRDSQKSLSARIRGLQQIIAENCGVKPGDMIVLGEIPPTFAYIEEDRRHIMSWVSWKGASANVDSVTAQITHRKDFIDVEIRVYFTVYKSDGKLGARTGNFKLYGRIDPP